MIAKPLLIIADNSGIYEFDPMHRSSITLIGTSFYKRNMRQCIRHYLGLHRFSYGYDSLKHCSYLSQICPLSCKSSSKYRSLIRLREIKNDRKKKYGNYKTY